MTLRGATTGTPAGRFEATTPWSVDAGAPPLASVLSQLGGVDVGTFTGLPGPYRAAAVFVVVLAIGTVLVSRYESRVDRAVDQTKDWSPLALLYGLLAFVLVGVIAAYVVTQVARLNVVGAPLIAITVAGAGSLAVLATFGCVVFGTWLTEIEGARRPWPGVVIGAVLCAVPWLVLPTLPSLAACALLAAVGLGSPTRNWVHAAHAVDPDRTA